MNVLIIQVLAQIMTVILLALVWLRKSKNREIENLRSAPLRVSHTDRLSLVSLLAAQYFAGGDRFLLSLFTTPDQVAYYSVGATFALVSGLLVSAAIPSVQNVSSSGSAQNRRRVVLCLLSTFLTSIVIVVLAPWLVNGIFGSAYSASIDITRIVQFSVLPMAIYSLTLAFLVGSRRYRLSALASSTAVGASALAIVLLGEKGAIGASLALVFASLMGCLFGCLALKRALVARPT
jgi:O-antigen/teichoic acid export membrane protein